MIVTTWNSQGYKGLAYINFLGTDKILCIQECGNFEPFIQWQNVNVDVFNMDINRGTRSRPNNNSYTYWPDRLAGNPRCSLAIVTGSDITITSYYVLYSQIFNRPIFNRPILNVIVNNINIGNVHAPSGVPNFAALYINKITEFFANNNQQALIFGDFNIAAGAIQFQNGFFISTQNQPTQTSDATLDYMIHNLGLAPFNNIERGIDRLGSDHWPVQFYNN